MVLAIGLSNHISTGWIILHLIVSSALKNRHPHKSRFQKRALWIHLLTVFNAFFIIFDRYLPRSRILKFWATAAKIWVQGRRKGLVVLQFLADQLTLFKPGGQIMGMPTTLLLPSPARFLDFPPPMDGDKLIISHRCHGREERMLVGLWSVLLNFFYYLQQRFLNRRKTE